MITSNSFSKPSKNLIFNNKEDCIKTSEKLNKNNSAISFITLSTKNEIKEKLYPRIEEFHKKCKKNVYSLNNNIFKSNKNKLLSNKKLSIYKKLDKEATYNTLEYIYNEFHRAVFVQILNNKIFTFVLLDNIENGYKILKNLKVDKSKFKNLDDFIEYIKKVHFQKYNVIRRKEDSIYFTNCAINLWKDNNNEVKVDWIYTYQYHMINELLKHKKINDIEFILNFKDQTMLVKDGETVPHFNIIGNLTTPLDKKYKPFIPILNFGSHNKFADIPIPTNDDYELITNKIFLGTCRNLYINVQENINRNYDKKIPTAIFRGGATGCGTIIKNNPRLKVAYLSKKNMFHPKYGIENNKYPYLDARVTSFKKRIKKHYSEEYISFINPQELKLKSSKQISIGEISNYKYIINIEGNIAAFRLSLELSYNSVILLVKSDYYLWYQPLLKEWIHYVPIKSDLSDLMDKIEWCKNNDNKCKKIANNAFEFYVKYINYTSINDYLELILNN